MNYVIAAYAISIGAVAFYLLQLVRERGQLRRDLEAGEFRPAGGAFRN